MIMYAPQPEKEKNYLSKKWRTKYYGEYYGIHITLQLNIKLPDANIKFNKYETGTSSILAST